MPVAGAVTTCVSRATGSTASGSPPWAAIIRRQWSMAEPSASRSAGSTSVTPGGREHLAGQGERQLDDVGRPATGEHLDRLGHLEGVARP